MIHEIFARPITLQHPFTTDNGETISELTFKEPGAFYYGTWGDPITYRESPNGRAVEYDNAAMLEFLEFASGMSPLTLANNLSATDYLTLRELFRKCHDRILLYADIDHSPMMIGQAEPEAATQGAMHPIAPGDKLVF